MRLRDLSTPALIVDLAAFDHNVGVMGARWPGPSLRPHVKAFKSTAVARRLADAGHTAFCAATAAEVLGLAEAGLGHDLLLANELVDPARLAAMAAASRAGARVTVAVDSPETIAAAAAVGIPEVLIDVDVGMPRCGCTVEDAGPLADLARRAGLTVRGVMGYEGHLVGLPDRAEREAGLDPAMAALLDAHAAVGGDIVSGGGTGTWDSNHSITELQAGSFVFLDTAYARLDLPFRPALAVLGTILSLRRRADASIERAVVDVGLKALGMDHGNPTIEGATVWFCSDEHTTFSPGKGHAPTWKVGDRMLVWPAHLDPTVSQHQVLHVIADGIATPDVADHEVIDLWPIDLRHW